MLSARKEQGSTWIAPEALPHDVVSLTLRTLRALISPKRAIPIMLVAAPLIYAQFYFARGRLLPLAMALMMCGSFVAVAPLAWRLLMPMGRPVSFKPLRVMIYAGICVMCVYFVGVFVPWLAGGIKTFLTFPVATLVIDCALFWVGGWGLGRDIDLEENLNLEKRRAETLQREAERAQLLALRANLDPHFLFNTLNAIAEWCREDGEVAERAVLELSRMLRTVLEGVKRPSWALSREVELLRTLFSLHRLRDPALFELIEDIEPAALEIQVPPIILLPMAENAMKHGPAKGHRGRVRFAIKTLGDSVSIEIENPGPFTGRREGGQGLAMIERRADLFYGERATFAIEGTGADRTVSRLVLPQRSDG